MDEAQNLADRVAVIAGGVIVAAGTPDTLGGRGDGGATIAFRAAAGLRAPAPFDTPPGSDGFVRVEVADPTPALHALTGWALSSGVNLEGLSVTRPSLEDVYLQLTRDTADG